MKTLIFILSVSLVLTGCTGTPSRKTGQEPKGTHPFGWDQITQTARPATFWWWLGSSVNEAEIERQLTVLKEAGFGGVMVSPLYEYKDPTIPPIEFLSDRWNEVFRFTLAKGKELGMLVDVTTGGGWPIGGPWITRDNSERDWRLEVLALNVTSAQPMELTDQPGKDPIWCVTLLENAAGDAGTDTMKNPGPAKVIEPEMVNGKKIWKLPAVGPCQVLIARMGYTGFNVYVSGKGATGPVFDYWSPAAFENLVQKLNGWLTKIGSLRPRAVYCDSFEGRGGTTPAIFEAFEKINGYDIRPYLHQFLSESGTPENIRLWHDYRQTIAALHVEFVKRWTTWANENQMVTRYQYTGDPANPLNTCGAADIPEDAPPFNTSAAHIFGKKLISAEEYTWGAGHNFKDYLDYYRKRGDVDLMQGLNHKVYHGTPFTPLSEPWPGPMYYAGGNFSETQPFFRHIRYLNDYFARLQLILQESKPSTDVVMLWSIHDFWNLPNEGGFKWGQPFVWRNSNSAIYREDTKEKTRAELVKRGIQTDMCSDEMIMEHSAAENGQIGVGVANYRLLVVPETKMVANGTLKKIEQLVRDGATVIFMKNIPDEAPVGTPLVQDQIESSAALKGLVKTGKPVKGGAYIASGIDELLLMLRQAGLSEEGIPGRLSTLRVNTGGRMTYLIRNNTDEHLDLWIPLVHLDNNCSQTVVGNPRTAGLALAEHRANPAGGRQVHLLMEPSELLTVTEARKQEKWKNIEPIDYRARTLTIPIGQAWKLTWKDYDGMPHKMQTETLKSWTEWPEIGLFSGTVSYETSFVLNEQEATKTLFLDAGQVHESAEVFINGKKAGCVWTTPFVLNLSGYLKEGENTIVLEVVNKAQNRIIDLERQGIAWQKSHLEEVSDDRSSSGPLKVGALKPMPSGLIGPVRLIGFETKL